MFKALIACGAFAVCAAAFPAAAAQAPIVVEGGYPTEAVSYADLDLSLPGGRATLDGRVARAASALCMEGGHKPVENQVAERRCLSVALAKARADIDKAVADATVRLASRSTIIVAAR